MPGFITVLHPESIPHTHFSFTARCQAVSSHLYLNTGLLPGLADSSLSALIYLLYHLLYLESLLFHETHGEVTSLSKGMNF